MKLSQNIICNIKNIRVKLPNILGIINVNLNFDVR